MKTLSLNVVIKDTDKSNGNLKDDFKLNVEVNFIKSILDFVKEGNDITINGIMFSRKEIEFEEDVEAIDSETKEKKILKDKVKKDCYNCVGIINIHKKIKGKKQIPRTEIMTRMTKGSRVQDRGRR